MHTERNSTEKTYHFSSIYFGQKEKDEKSLKSLDFISVQGKIGKAFPLFQCKTIKERKLLRAEEKKCLIFAHTNNGLVLQSTHCQKDYIHIWIHLESNRGGEEMVFANRNSFWLHLISCQTAFTNLFFLIP